MSELKLLGKYQGKLLVAGQLKGEYHNSTIAFIKENNFENEIILTSFISEELKTYLYCNADFTFRAINAGYSVYCNYDAVLYMYPEESGDTKLRRKKNWNNYRQHLFGIKGGGNLKYFYFFAIKNCPKKYLPIFLPIGIIRRAFGYLRDWIAGE